MAQTDRHPDILTDRHGDSMTESAQWGHFSENVYIYIYIYILDQKNYIFTLFITNTLAATSPYLLVLLKLVRLNRVVVR